METNKITSEINYKMKAADIWWQYTTFKAKTQGNRVLVTQGCSLSRFFLPFVKLYWAKSKRIQTNKELKPKRDGHERDTDPCCGVPTLGKYKDLKNIRKKNKNQNQI